MVSLSILDLSPIVEGGDAGQALRNSRDLAHHAERWGYRRFWMAEHHNMTGIASAATAVALAYVGAGTSTIRIGSGGIMLPNHAPLVIAEQFGTLAALYPGRIDLGLGRAPGTDQLTAQALAAHARRRRRRFSPRRGRAAALVRAGGSPARRVRAVPGAGEAVEPWILGSSTFGAQLAAALGLPYAFASHFAPADMEEALRLYRERFQPSERLDRPRVMLGLNVVAAPTDAEARRLFTSLQQAFLALRAGQPGRLPPPVDDLDERLDDAGRAMVAGVLARSVVGSPATVREGVAAFAARTGADELICTGSIFDHDARLGHSKS